MLSPLEQFEIFPLLGSKGNIYVTNFSLIVFLITSSVILSFFFSLRKLKLIPTRWQAFFEILYDYVLKILMENATKRAQPYFPFVFLLFNFILVCNLFGMFPFGYAVTSQVLITFLFSCTVFLGSIFIGLRKHNVNFFSLFFPSGSPTSLSFLLVPIELLSFVSRPFSLGIRLFANMLAGHVLLKIIAGFIFSGIAFAMGTLILDKTFLTKLVEFNTNLIKKTPFTIYHNEFKLNLIFSFFCIENINFDKIVFYDRIITNDATAVYNGYNFLEEKFSTTFNEKYIIFSYISSVFALFKQVVFGEDTLVVFSLENLFFLEEDAKNGATFFSKSIGFLKLHFPFIKFNHFSFFFDFFFKIVIMAAPIFILSAFILLELGIAFLQAYVFTILTTIYIGDAINLH